MSADGVKAGKAYVELTTKDDSFRSGLVRAQARLTAWAHGLTIAGGVIQATGVAGLAAIGALAKSFADRGSEIHDLSQATGVSAEHLSALAYAAQQSGVAISDLSAGMRGLAKFTGKLAGGNKEAAKTLEQLGLSSGEFLAAIPDERLALVADGLRRIEDPGLRAALAMKLLGKSGAGLLPMLAEGSAGLNAFLQRAAELGLVISAEDAKRADALGDAWDDLLATLSALAFRVGSAVAESLTAILNAVVPVVAGTAEFVKHNQSLVVTLVAVAVGATIVGGALIGLGGALALVTLAMGACTSIAAACSAVMAAIVSPMGLIVIASVGLTAALVVGGVAFLQYTQLGQAMLAGLTNVFNQLGAIATKTFGGIYTALSAGRLDLAANVASAGVYTAFARLWANLRSGWAAIKAWTIGLMAQMASGIVQQVRGALMATMALVNAVRAQIGMAPVGPIKLLDKVLNKAQSLAGRVESAAWKQAASETSAANADAQAAQSALSAAIAAAEKAKAELDAKNKAEVGNLTSGAVGRMPSILSPGGSTLGTFSAAVAGLLGKSGPDTAAERTAKATEEMADDMAALRRHVEDGGLEFA